MAAAVFQVEGVAGATGASGDLGARRMASIAKLIFAVMLLDERPLAPGEQRRAITSGAGNVARPSDSVRRGATVLPVGAGEVLTQLQLLEAAMLQSTANATMTLANWAFGSRDAYLSATERWLASEGIEGIRVADSSRLSSRGVATTQGLLQLMAPVDERPALREITGLTETTLPRLGLARNSNEVLGSAGIDSGKTGNLHASGRTVLVGATRDVGGVAVRIHVALLGPAPTTRAGCVTTITIDPTTASAASHPCNAYTTSRGRTARSGEAGKWGQGSTA